MSKYKIEYNLAKNLKLECLKIYKSIKEKYELL